MVLKKLTNPLQILNQEVIVTCYILLYLQQALFTHGMPNNVLVAAVPKKGTMILFLENVKVLFLGEHKMKQL